MMLPVTVCCWALSLGSTSPAVAQLNAAHASAEASLESLRQTMDRFHEHFYVYSDVSAPSNHFVVLGAIGNASVTVNGSWAQNPRSGASTFRFTLSGSNIGQEGGFYFLNGEFQDEATAPQPNWGTEPNAGIDLSEAVTLHFSARGETGGEIVKFFLGGVGSGSVDFPDSSSQISATHTLTDAWQDFSIDVSTADLSYVLGGFGWTATISENPAGATFYVDEIYYELSPAGQEARYNEPRFLQSFETEDLQFDCLGKDDIFDLAFRNLAFTYDNALVLLAFLASGTADDLRRARLIGDAFVYAAANDRQFTDGRLRSAYLAGDMVLPPGWHPNGLHFTMGIPGFWCEEEQRYIEMEQSSNDVGNNAWAMIALLALYEETLETSYLEAARDLGAWIRTQKAVSGTYQGFTGGIDDPEGDVPAPRSWASGEHNLDVVAAFRNLGAVDSDPSWTLDAEHAETLVDQLWSSEWGCYLAGTTNSEVLNTNFDQVPLDMQSWSLLALHDRMSLRPEALSCAENRHRLGHSGFQGFDFNTDKDGVWFEGTAQMALAYLSMGRWTSAAFFQRELQRAQSTAPYGDGEGLWAATIPGLTTGFDFKYLQRVAIAAAAWNVFAQKGYDPYYQRQLPQPLFADGFESGDLSAW